MLLGEQKQSECLRGDLAGRTGRNYDLRQPKVENLGVSALGDKDVRRLDVAVDDAFGVGGVERVGDLDPRASNALVSRGFPAMRCFSVTPSRNSITMNGWPSCFADFVDRADIGMVQSGSSLRFSLKAF